MCLVIYMVSQTQRKYYISYYKQTKQSEISQEIYSQKTS